MGVPMGILYHRLLIILNEESQDSTYYHIAMIMLKHIKDLGTIGIDELADLCNVAKSTISKFIRVLGYESYSEFRYAADFRDNKYDNDFNYVADVMHYIKKNSMDAFVEAMEDDIRATYDKLDYQAVDRLVLDLVKHEKVGVFGLMFSETAAMDFQLKLGYNKKFVITNMNDMKQEEYIRHADKNTLIVIFSDSGEYINQYKSIDDFLEKDLFRITNGKVVVITSNPNIKKDPRVSYTIEYQKTKNVCTHRIVYALLTDIIAYRYREYMKQGTKYDIK